jgi:fatty acid-binding protein DegV
MNCYLVKRYRRGRELAEGAKVLADNDAEAIDKAKRLYDAKDRLFTEFRVANCYELREGGRLEP